MLPVEFAKYQIEEFLKSLYGGIRLDIPGHGGAECAAYLSPGTKIAETCLSTVMMLVCLVYALKHITLPSKPPPQSDHFWTKPLLALLCLVLGLEISFKITSGELLYILNPCHVLTVVEIFLLMFGRNRMTLSILRGLIHYVYVSLIALMFPEMAQRQRFGEVADYWLQHILIIFIVPPYLIYTWGPDKLEPLNDWSWACLAGICFGIQHHYILQPIAMVTHVNLNFLLCPAEKDPFHGPYYRTWAIFHQALCLLLLGKLYTIIVTQCLPKQKQN